MSNEKSQTCLSCGKEYQRIGSHWSRGSCSHPKLTEEQKEILTGLIMGDGCVSDQCGKTHPRFITTMVVPEYLEWLDSKFPQYGTGVSTRCMKNDPGNWQQAYDWQTRTSPEFNEWLRWYDSGSKVFPDDVEITPLVLKNWYVTDGTFNTSGRHFSIRIAASNERGNEEKLKQYFNNKNLPTPKLNTGCREQNGTIDNWLTIYWNNGETKELFEYMGDPLPDSNINGLITNAPANIHLGQIRRYRAYTPHI